ncbi:MAG TPA: PEGA domain-containing protein [Geobacterales bacterium]|nr:PEGA domain-containing protein [Geobacterales bacterium]
MRTTIQRFLLIAAALATLFACHGREPGEKLELSVETRLEGKPFAGARILADGEKVGETDASGHFTGFIYKRPGSEVQISVDKEQEGYTIMPWKGSFVMKLPQEGKVDRYEFVADLKASQYFTLQVTDAGKPVQGATVTVNGNEAGITDEKGEFLYEAPKLPAGGVAVVVRREGFAPWQEQVKASAGERVQVALSSRSEVTITAMTEEYGKGAPLAGVVISIGGRTVGKTNAKGTFTYTVPPASAGRKAKVGLEAPGRVPAYWEKSVTLAGIVEIQRYFYPATPKSIRTGIYGFSSNTPGVDLHDALDRTEEALRSQLFRAAAFREVPTATLKREMKKSRISIEKVAGKGWQGSSLAGSVDLIIVGSVARDDRGFLVETKCYSSNGKVLLSYLTRARNAGELEGAAKEIVAAIFDRFPFEGTVILTEADRFRINLGKSGYRISRGMEFDAKTPKLDASGKVTGYRSIGSAKVKKVDDNGAWLVIEDLKKGDQVAEGDRVIRFVAGEADGEKTACTIKAMGGVAPDLSPLAGVNIYLNDQWVATTGSDGRAEVPIRTGKNYNLTLYRHGYQQVVQKFKIDKNGETRDFAMQVNNSLFRLESQPSGAAVYLDGEQLGKTPFTDKPVTLGFHTVRLSAGEDYRDWEEVVEFDQKVEDRTGSRKITLYKDYLKLAQDAQRRGNIDGAIQFYASTEKGHPDFSEAHSRLAQIYLDEKSDYDGAIREYEMVMNLPENKQLVYKQFAIAYTNLGHAYYERGNALVNRDKDGASKYLAKAVQNLQIAKQNTRFFPTQQYDEAVHDTYYYQALSLHKLYLITRKPSVQASANVAFREYFDFFPRSLEGNSTFMEHRETAQKYWDQIRE